LLVTTFFAFNKLKFNTSVLEYCRRTTKGRHNRKPQVSI